MKKIIGVFTLFLLLNTGISYAQPGPTSNPSEKKEPSITLVDNTTITGELTDNIRKKGEVILVINGKKTRYKAGDVNFVQTTNTRYVTSNYIFYEVVYSGKNFTLLRKASEPNGLQYNGTDAVVVSSEGNIDDLFLKKENGTPQLITSKNLGTLLGSACNYSQGSSKIDMETLKNTLEQCDQVQK
jgi:hypothetical protein